MVWKKSTVYSRNRAPENRSEVWKIKDEEATRGAIVG